MRNMGVSHQQAILADNCLACRTRAATQRHKLPNDGVFPDEKFGAFPLELQILRLPPIAAPWKIRTPFANRVPSESEHRS